MHWVAPSEKDTANETLEKRLWAAADQFRANSGLKAAEYSSPVLGLIFLRFAEARFAKRRAALETTGASSRRSGSRIDEPAAYHAEGVLFLTPNARFDLLLQMPEGGNIGGAVNEAMADIEKHNPTLAGVLPRNYQIFNGTLLKELLKKVSEIPVTLDYDAFGRIYEYFLGQFARTEGQKGGEFYTPAPIVRLMVEILEPFHGRILDPACGSGGMFVQSARFVAEHKKNPASELSVFGVEKTDETGRLARMNLAVHGLEGDIRHGGDVCKELDERRGTTNESLGLLRPKRILRLDITRARNPDWTEEERAKLLQEQMQGKLFNEAEAAVQVRELKKIPFDFYYSYLCDSPNGEFEERHKIVDWEVGALYWNCRRSHGEDWEKPFRAMLEENLTGKDLMFLMGNQHRFQDQWLIVSLIYPPKQKPVSDPQSKLF